MLRGQVSRHPGGRGDERPLRGQHRLRPILQVLPGQGEWPLCLQGWDMSRKDQASQASSSHGESKLKKLHKELQEIQK